MDREYTLERMFTNQLLESAKDESSYRTVVKDVKTKSPLLQIVLLNPNSWSCAGNCVEAEGHTGPVSNMYLHPVIKVLYSDCSNSTESQSRFVCYFCSFSICFLYSFIIIEGGLWVN